MSQDLLAAFGEAPAHSAKSGSSASSAPSFSFFDDLNSSTNNAAPPSSAQAPATNTRSNTAFNAPSFRTDAVQSNDDNDDDDWGDFEGSAEVTAPPRPAATAKATLPAQAPVPIATQFSRWLDEEDDGFKDYSQPQRTSSAKQKWDFTKPEPPSQPKQQQARDPNVLFDAEDEPPLNDDDDDDFGDFEGADESVKPAAPVQADIGDLLGGDFTSGPLPASKPHTSMPATRAPQATSNSLLDLEDLSMGDESTIAWNDKDNMKPPIHGFGTLGALARSPSPTKPIASAPNTKRSKSPEKKPAKPAAAPVKKRNVLRKAPPPQPVATEDLDETWDDFEAWSQDATAPPSTSVQTEIPIASSTEIHTMDIPPPLTTTSDNTTSTITSPPTNIPPPALVLTLFSPLFTTASSTFFTPIRSESTSVQNGIYASPSTTLYLKGLLSLATVLGRIIAGRKLRWKRDNILAQSMRIAVAGSGGGGGLKLTSIDRAETVKEEREVADALKSWSLILGKLKACLAEVRKVTGAEVGKVPELKEVLVVKVASEIEGGLRGNRACALCGLKREERVVKVDWSVEDSFGEWWVEGPSMHRECRNFWEKHRDALRSR